jgi:hypothetical protein
MAAGAALVVALVATTGIQAQDQFQLVILATDQSGMPVTDLKPEEFTMAENGMPGKVVLLEHLRPVRLTLIVDNGPDSDRLLDSYRTGLATIVDALPPEVEVGLITTAGQAREQVKPTADRGVLKKAFARLGKDSDDARFTDAIVEFTQRLQKDIKEKKLTYVPMLLLVSAIGGDPTSYPLTEVETSIVAIANAGGRANVVVTTSKLNDATARQDLSIGRQGQIGAKLAKQTGGEFQTLPDPRTLGTLLPEWGKQVAEAQKRQTTRYRLVLQRPAGVTGPIQNLDLRVTRPGVSASLSK